MRDHPSLPAGRGFAPVRLIDQRRDVSRRAYAAGGFTLLEVVLVIGLMVLLASFAWPALQSRFDHAQLPESGDQLRSLMELTRAQARIDHRRYRIRFAPNERQPIVEWEKDPFQAPGKFEAVKADWTSDDRLLGDAQVHEIRPGRPEYTLPLDDERSEQQETETTEVVVGGDDSAVAATDDGAAAAPPPAEKLDDAPIDEKRPALVFEPDGSSDWATIIVANVTSEKPLEDSAEQIWIEIDGRSGLASIRPSLSEQEMADASLRVPRSKLRPPEVAFGKDMSINAVTQQKPGQGTAENGEKTAGLGGDGMGAGGGTPKLPGGASSLDALNQLSKLAGGQQPGGGDQNGQGKQPPDRKQGDGLPGQRPPRQRPPQGQPSQGENQNQNQQNDQNQNDQTPTDGSQTDTNNQNNDNQNDTTTQPTDQQP